MDRGDSAVLGRLLASAEPPGPDGTTDPGRCGLCDCRIDDADAVVEVAIDGEGTDPDARLCEDCYEYVVEEMGVAPTSVFKSGRRRSVVLPVGGVAEPGSG